MRLRQHILAALLATGGLALAATLPLGDTHNLVRAKPSVLYGLAALDLNGDGRASRREAAIDRELLFNFETLDVNGDDELSPDEYRKYVPRNDPDDSEPYSLSLAFDQ